MSHMPQELENRSKNAASITPRSIQMHSSFKLPIFVAVLAVIFAAAALQAQAPCTPVTFTADQDHQNMMDQLGIKTLRPGWNGNEKAPDHANYDESKANPYPNVPDPLTLSNGTKVATADIVVEAAPPRTRRHAFEICLWLCAGQSS